MDRLYVIVYQNVSSSDKNFDLVTYIYVIMSTYSHIYVTKSIFLSDDPTFWYTITYSRTFEICKSNYSTIGASQSTVRRTDAKLSFLVETFGVSLPFPLTVSFSDAQDYDECIGVRCTASASANLIQCHSSNTSTYKIPNLPRRWQP